MRGRSSIHSKSKRTTLFYNVVLLDLGRPYEPFLNQKLMRCCLAVLACSVSWRGEENRKPHNPTPWPLTGYVRDKAPSK